MSFIASRSMRSVGASAPIRRMAALQSRAASTTSTTDAAKEQATQAANKAKETANNATEQAKSYVDKAQKQGGQVLDQISQRAGGLLGAYREPLVYNLAVLRELGKQVYIAEKLSPPTNLSTIRSAYEEFYHNASNASWWRSILESGEWKRYAIYAVEAYGIFTIGEMIGRRHIVGYKKLDDGSDAHHH